MDVKQQSNIQKFVSSLSDRVQTLEAYRGAIFITSMAIMQIILCGRPKSFVIQLRKKVIHVDNKDYNCYTLWCKMQD